VRRLAAERGIDLAAIAGSGPQGRIVRRDLDAWTRPHPPIAPGDAASVPSPATVATAADAAYVDVPHTGMRRAIARRLTESTSTVPDFQLVAHCRVDELLALRARINEQGDYKVSVNDLVVKAVARAMQDVPDANAVWTDDATRRFTGVDIAIAVSVPAGLVTPVVRGADRLSLTELTTTIRDLAERARDGRLKQHELEGGSFSVSNLGMYGTEAFSAIINPPHAGILAVGAATKRPVVDDDGALAVATVMTVTLSADHRVLDGALAAQWLAAFVRRIENPLSILI
jgi:pyruvate dehydrogenase E2 component (dihydrolipoamide acetyltransferase)